MAGNLKNEIIFVTCLLACRSVEGQITYRPDDQEVCKNEDLKIDWAYGDASNFLTVKWAFKNSSSAAGTTFMSRTTGASTATVIGDMNVEFNGNGAITLKQVDFSYTGNYTISVTYISSTPPDDDTVTVTVKDCGVSDCECCLHCNIPLPGCIFLWILIGVGIACLISAVVILILRFVVGVRFPCGILNCENKKTSPKDSKTGKTKSTAGNTQPPKDEVNEDLVMEDKKETRVDFDKSSAGHTKKRPPAKLDQLNEPGSEKHHIVGRPLPDIGKYN